MSDPAELSKATLRVGTSANAQAHAEVRPVILLVEDEMIIAFDLTDRLEDGGFAVDGPYPSIERALRAIEVQIPDGAVLDVQLTDGAVYPVADRLTQLDVPIVFHSGHANPEDLRSRYPSARICTKPCPIGTLEGRLREVVPNAV